MSEKPQRRTFSAAQKVAIVKRHLIDKVAVSDLCEEYQIQPTLFYQWQKQLFENGTAAFERKGKSKATTPSSGGSPSWRIGRNKRSFPSTPSTARKDIVA